VNNQLAGEYRSAFKGQGMTFAEFREYVHGDDVRDISWNITARTGKPFIKKYDEERELTLMLVCDVSGSGDYGSQKYFKGEITAYLAGLLGFSAAKNNDHVGLLLFSDNIEHYVPPQKGRVHIHRLLRDLLYFKPRSRGTHIGRALDHLRGALKKRSMVFIISDFMSEGFSQSLRYISRYHETVAISIDDPTENELPQVGLVEFEDLESGELVAVDTSSKAVRNAYRREMIKRKEKRVQDLRSAQVETIEVVVGDDYVEPLIRYFRRRTR
jgi:uncharacterized protein (DUF58 family)